MRTRSFFKTLLLLSLLIPSSFCGLLAQETGKPNEKTKEQKDLERSAALAEVEKLVNSRQFVFQAEFGQNSDQVFVVVDTTYGELQYGIRNNIEGKISGWNVKRNDKKKTLAVSFKVKSYISNADVFLLIGDGGTGRATIRKDELPQTGMIDPNAPSAPPGSFSFDGKIVDFEHCQIYEGKANVIR